MPFVQRILALCLGIGLMLLVVELVRRRKLKEEYSVLWLLLGLTVLVLASWFPLVKTIGVFLHASTTSVILFFGVVFLLLIALHYSVKISRLTHQVKELAQEVVLLKAEIEKRD